MSRYYDDTLIHYQRKGAHWGVKNGPPYPLNSAGLAKFRKKVKEFKDGAADRKRMKQVKKAAKAEEKLEKRREKHEKQLEALSKSPTYLYKNRDAFTTSELNKALDRINAEQRIYDASMRELKRPKELVDTIIGYGMTVNNAYKTFDSMSKNYKKFKNGEFGKPDSKKGKKEKKKKKKEEKTDKGDSSSSPSSTSSKPSSTSSDNYRWSANNDSATYRYSSGRQATKRTPHIGIGTVETIRPEDVTVEGTGTSFKKNLPSVRTRRRRW